MDCFADFCEDGKKTMNSKWQEIFSIHLKYSREPE
jgi:hypothetical protein